MNPVPSPDRLRHSLVAETCETLGGFDIPLLVSFLCFWRQPHLAFQFRDLLQLRSKTAHSIRLCRLARRRNQPSRFLNPINSESWKESAFHIIPLHRTEKPTLRAHPKDADSRRILELDSGSFFFCVAICSLPILLALWNPKIIVPISEPRN